MGTGTLTVSLPSKWIKENNIKQGEELEVLESGEELIINSKRNNSKLKRITIDAKGLSSSLILRKIYIAYILGYEEIEILVDNNEIEHTATKYLSLVEKMPKKLTTHEVIPFINSIGVEIVEQDKNRYLLSIMVSSDIDFEKTFKRLFTLTKSYGEEVLEYTQKGFNGSVNRLYSQEITINKFYRLCLRIINSSVSGPRKTCLYDIVSRIEELGDVYWDIIQKSQPKKVNKESLKRFKEFNGIFTQFYSEFFKDSEENLSKIYSSIKKLEREIQRNSGELSFLHGTLLTLCDILKNALQGKLQLMMIKE